MATPTGPVGHLTPVTMTDPGSVVKLRILAFVAGAVSMKVCVCVGGGGGGGVHVPVCSVV